MTPPPRFSCADILYVLWLFTAPAVAGDIQGRVCNDGKEAPNDGLSGVSVSVLTSAGNVIDARPSAADGTYEVKEVPNGKVTVRLKKLGFAKDPTEIEVEVTDGDNQADHAFLWENEPSDASYYTIVAHHMIRRVNLSDDQQTAFVAEWIYLTSANVSPMFKRKLAPEIEKLDDSAKTKLPIISDYLKTPPESIGRLQIVCSRVAAGQSPFPDQDYLEKLAIPVNIFTETVLWKAYDPSMPMIQRRTFEHAFGDVWSLDSEPATALKSWYRHPKLNWSTRLDSSADEMQALFEYYRKEG